MNTNATRSILDHTASDVLRTHRDAFSGDAQGSALSRTAIVCLALIAFASQASPQAQATGSVTIERIDGSTLKCAVASITSAEAHMQCPDPITLALDELRRVSFPATNATSATGKAIFHLAAGGRMRGTITAQADESVVIDTSFATGLTIPFGSLAGVWLGGENAGSTAYAMFEESLADRLAGKDILITRRRDEVATIRGSITALGPKGGRVLIGKTERPFSFDRVSGIVFATGLGNPTRWPAHVTLTDDTQFAGRLVGGDAADFLLQTPFGIEIKLPVEKIARLRFDSERVVYLGDLTPTAEQADGIVQVPVPARVDRSAGNGPISLDGRRYPKGIGVHARSRLTYDLNSAYETLAATVGIDDAVRPRGSVVFKVEGDHRALFDSDVLSGNDRAKSFTADLRGVKELVLIVDYATDMDLSDDADWADVRLIKPRSAGDGSTPQP